MKCSRRGEIYGIYIIVGVEFKFMQGENIKALKWVRNIK